MFAFSRKKRGFWEFQNTPKFLSSQLNRRIKIFEPVQAEASDGGFSQTHSELKEIWAGIKPVSHASYMRWSSTEGKGTITHEAIIRKNAVDDLHTQYAKAFSAAFDSIADLNPIKSNMYFLLVSGTSKGRFFRIRRAMNAEEKGEYISILCEEVEELGTGAPGIDEEGIFG